MRVVFMGTPDFAVPTLEAIHRSGHEVVYVVTQPDATRDRGRKLHFSPVKEKALELGIEVLQPEKIKKNTEFIEQIAGCDPDVIVVAAYGRILPKALLDVPAYGCINVHASLLPRFRGAAPIQAAIMEGDEVTGVTIMLMSEGLDTGDMIGKASIPVNRKTGAQLHDELASLGANLLVKHLPHIGSIDAEQQDDRLATYAPMISKKDGHIDFAENTWRIERTIRAFDPWPGTYGYLGDRMMKFWSAEALTFDDAGFHLEGRTGVPAFGTVLAARDAGIDIACNGGVLRVKELQMPGRRRVAAGEYLKGNSIEIGTVLG